MGIGFRIKEARERLDLTQTELGKLVGVTGSAITNYEKETSHPKEPVIYKLLEVLDVDANYLFQDCMKKNVYADTATPEEFEKIIKKYRALDERGRKMVDSALEEAYNTRPVIAEGQTSLLPIDGYWCIGHNGKWERIEKADFVGFETNAAHPDEIATTEEREADDNMMKDDSEWK